MKRVIVLACFVIVLLCGCSLFSKKTVDENKNDTKAETVVEQKPNGQIVSEVYGTGYGSTFSKCYVDDC